MKRTHTCGQLGEGDIGKKVVLTGWVWRRRDHGKLVFIDLRDRTGMTQIVFHPAICPEAHRKAQELRAEFVVEIEGEVNKRPKGTENSDIPTGMVEVGVGALEIINVSETPPFEIEEDISVSEEARMAYRFLDLRRPRMQRNLFLRHKISKTVRDFLDGEGFLDVETPILTKSTPEGARDFLVPSRLQPGDFYALPQSPQLFKQILMVSGIERYFQIAKCFRDEDLRADRQPEFSQVDIEMSFVEEEDIFELCERLMREIFRSAAGIELEVPFERITYQNAMEKHGTDKPDLRKEGEKFKFVWVTDFPLFNFNEGEKRWDSEHHPFTAPDKESLDAVFSGKDLDKVRARSYDLVVNGVELGSGSIRIHCSDLQKRIFEIIGIEEEEARERFGFLLEAFKYGAPPHGGVAFGLDRLAALLAGEKSIREVIAFPKTQRGICPLTGAPSSVDEKQLREVGIKLGGGYV